MNNITWVKIETNKYYKVISKLSDIGINIYDNKIFNNYILIKTNYSDYKKINKYLKSYKVNIYSSSGIARIKEVLKKYFVFSISTVIGIILLIFVNNLIFKIDVKSNNKEIQELITKELNKHDLGILKLKKSHKTVEKIVEQILNDNKEVIEWLEIKYDGLVLIVNVTEKTSKINFDNNDYCNIVATTNAKILSMNLYRGIAVKELNDYVNKGDIIVSGDITHNEEIKNNVCANGEIYGEVWYKVNVEVPYKVTYIHYTGKNRYNLSIQIDDKEYLIFKSRIRNKKKEASHLYELNDFSINLVKEKEYVTKTKILSEKEAYNKAVSLALEKVKIKLNDDEEILLKKVLKKQANDSTIYLEIFIVTKENIGALQVLEKESLNDNRNGNENS